MDQNPTDEMMLSPLLGDHGAEDWRRKREKKLCPPLQIQKKNGDFFVVDDDDDDRPHPDTKPNPNNSKLPAAAAAAGGFICGFCYKVFPSGKALGGHKRIHNNNNNQNSDRLKYPNNNKPLIKFKKRKPQEDITIADIAKNSSTKKKRNIDVVTGTSAVAADHVPTCFLCSKTFPSLKSLFGHMRSHPERVWRGIQPPPPPPTPAACSTSSDTASLVSDLEPQATSTDDQVNSSSVHNHHHQQEPAIDLTESLLGWSTTAKRGRKQTTFFDRDISAAEDLLSLARGDGNLFWEQRGVLFEEEDETKTNSNSFGYKVAKSDQQNGNNNKKKKKKRSFEQLSSGYMKAVKQLSSSYPEGRNSEERDDINETGLLVGKSVMNSKWEDDSRSWNYEGEEDNESVSRNSTEQEQVVMNHKITNGNGKKVKLKNKKKRKKMKNLESVQQEKEEEEEEEVEIDVAATTNTTPDKYRCGSCEKSFPTHQALGGHRSSNKVCRMSTAITTNSVEGWSQFSAGEDEDPLMLVGLMRDEENKFAIEKEEDEGRGSSSKQVVGEYKIRIKRKKAHHHHHKEQSGVGGGGGVPPSSRVSTSVGEHDSSHQTNNYCGRVLDFDLNETPPVELDHVDIAAEGFKTEHDDDDDDGVGGGGEGSFNSVEFPIFESSSSGV